VKQGLLEVEDPVVRLKRVLVHLQSEVQALQPRLQAVNELGPNSAARRQKELGLRQQMRSIQKDLSQQDEAQSNEIRDFQEKIRIMEVENHETKLF